MTPPPPRWHDPAVLDHLARVRRPWDRLARRIVAAAVGRFLPDPPGPLVEIGAGGGQLRQWLPPALAAATTHTDTSEPFLAALRTTFPDATAVRADATALPFAAGSASAVLGLCVLDTVPDLAAVRDEVGRVLRPGGVVLHVLDLATSPDALFPELIAGGELPLTNFARDPALRAVLSDEQKALLPPAGDFDEVLAVGWDAFARFVGMLEAARHPLAAALGPYRGLTRPGTLDPDRLAHGFMAASADPARLLALNRALLALTLLARGMGRGWPLRAVSARDHVRAKLRAAFGPDYGFAVTFAGPVAAWEDATGDDTTPPGVRFVLRHAGRTVSRPEITAIPGTPLTAPDGLGPSLPDAEKVRATTVEVFAARRVG